MSGPVLTVPDNLPIHARGHEIIAAVRKHSVVIVAGETGSGKTTQLPKLAALALQNHGVVGITQPRRLAARGVADRIAEETGLNPGTGVALRMRFEDRGAPDALFRVMTDGILLNELVADPQARAYDAIIVDEAHERSLNIDFVLGCLKKAIERRPSLKVIVTSATINTDRLSVYFNDAPVIEVSGRGYPIDIRHEEPPDHETLAQSILRAFEGLLDEPGNNDGDVLVFLPGEREIHEAGRYIEGRLRSLTASRRPEILKVYGRLADKEQRRVFSPGKKRRIILATNIAETSVTLPRIRAVIDTGLERVSRYAPKARIQRLETEKVTQASARQRAGRCGRIGPGICIRLYSEESLLERPPYPDPEIVRTHLASVVLRLLSARLGQIERFPWIDAPDSQQITDAYRLLKEIKAISTKQKITRLGRTLARLPVDPRLAAVLVEGYRLGVAAEARIVVAGLSVSDPRIAPAESRDRARRQHAVFAQTGSDVLTLVALYQQWLAQREVSKRRAMLEWCETHFLSVRRLFDWRELERQLARSATQIGLQEAAAPKHRQDQLTRALLTGFSTQVGRWEEGSYYLGPRGRRFVAHPSSVVADAPPPWVVATSFLRTHATYGLGIAQVKAKWVLAANRHLVRVEYRDVRWSVKQERVIADEAMYLDSLLLGVKRNMAHDKVVDPAVRSLFVLHALVRREHEQSFDFARTNADVVDELEQWSGRLRRSVSPAENELVAHYEQALPNEIQSLASLRSWLRTANDDDTQKLHLRRETWLADQDMESSLARRLPAEIQLGGNVVPVHYHYAPGTPADGASVEIPEALANRLTAQEIDDSLPGLLEGRVRAHLKALPKASRKRLQPIAKSAQQLTEALLAASRAGSLAQRLAPLLKAEFGIDANNVWHDWTEPPELGLRIHKTPADEHPEAEAAPVEGPSRVIPDGLFPQHGVLRIDHVAIDRYQALEPQGEAGVQLAWFPAEAAARQSHRAALQHLAALVSREQQRIVEKSLADSRLLLGLAAYRWAPMLGQDLWRAVIAAAFSKVELSTVRNHNDFKQLFSGLRGGLVESALTYLPLLESLATQLHEIESKLISLESRYVDGVEETRSYLSALFCEGFIENHGVDRLSDLVRYAQAAGLALIKLPQRLQEDTSHRQTLQRLRKRWQALPPQVQVDHAEIEWLLHELRVSLLAQQVGAKGKVSTKRLERHFEAIGG